VILITFFLDGLWCWTGDNDLKTASMLLSTYAKLQTPIFLRSLKVLFIYSKFLDSR